MKIYVQINGIKKLPAFNILRLLLEVGRNYWRPFPCLSSDKPSAPQNFHVSSSTGESVTLSWSPPRDNGGSNITDYILEKREALRMIWKPVATTSDTKHTITRLSEGTQYVFRIAAQNKVGVGEFVDLSKAVAAKSPHDTPSSPGAVNISDLYKDSCLLSWTPPVSDGGAPILGYYVERRTSASPRWSRVTTQRALDTSYNVSDLVPGTAYEFRVLAENRSGLSQPSKPTHQVSSHIHRHDNLYHVLVFRWLQIHKAL